MFRELVPLLRQRAVLLTVTHLEEDQIRVNVLPKQVATGENMALTTPFSVTGTAEELDEQLHQALVQFVAKHLELKNTLENAKAEMEAAAKLAKEEAKTKTKGRHQKAGTCPAKPEPSKPAPAPGLFDVLPPSNETAQPRTEDDEILKEIQADDCTHNSSDAPEDDFEDDAAAA